MSKFFNFEEKDCDIPFYNGIPELSKGKWGLLVLGLILFFALIGVPIDISDTVFSILMCLVLLIPTLIALNGNWSLMFKKIRRSDLKPIIIAVVIQLVYSFLILYVLEYAGMTSSSPASTETASTTLISFISMVIQLMGEELFQVILMIILMAITYKFLNRKVSIVISVIITLAAFGFLHEGYYGGLLQVLLVQGLGSLLTLLLYIKTKNIMVSYASHLLYDCFPLLLEIIIFLLSF